MEAEISSEKVVNGGDVWKAHIAIAAVQLLYAVYLVITKVALIGGVNQFVFCVYRDILAILILAPVAYFREKRVRPPINARLLMTFFFLGLTGIFGNQLLFILGLGYTNPTYAAALLPATPVFTFILTLILGMQVVNLRKFEGQAKLGGTLVCISGAVLMATFRGPVLLGSEKPDFRGTHDASITIFLGFGIDEWKLGILCLIGGCVCIAVYLVVQAPLLAKYPASISVTAYSYFFGAMLMAITAIFTIHESADWHLKNTEILTVLYAGIVSSAVNNGISTWTNKILGPALVSLYSPLEPVVAAVLSKIFLGSPIYVGSILGGLLVVTGLYLVTWASYNNKQARLKISAFPSSVEPLINRDSSINVS